VLDEVVETMTEESMKKYRDNAKHKNEGKINILLDCRWSSRGFSAEESNVDSLTFLKSSC
jgi:hypothetical protein